VNGKDKRSRMQWYRMDIHNHTPASKDYQQPGITYLEVLQQAERRGLNIVAFTDHNTVRGYRTMREEIEPVQCVKRLSASNGLSS
jgi:predicted metal-dependent phosphoesterase TrpH